MDIDDEGFDEARQIGDNFEFGFGAAEEECTELVGLENEAARNVGRSEELSLMDDLIHASFRFPYVLSLWQDGCRGKECP